MLFRLYTVRFIRARMQHSKDSRHVARCKTARSDGDCQQRSDHFNSCPDSGQAARPGRCTWQPLQHVCSSQLGSPFSVLLASSTQTSRPLLDHRCRQDGDPGVCILTPGLLQLTVLRHLRRLGTTTTSGSERCGTSRCQYAEARSYQPSPSAAALVTSSPAYKI